MFEEGSKIYSVMEYVDGMNLYDYREKKMEAGNLMDPMLYLHVLHEISKGMEYFYNLDIIHRDIKPENIVVSTDMTTVKIIDFDFAIIDDGQIRLTMGTMLYRPVNVDYNRLIDRSYDMWSLGATMYYLMCGSDIKDDMYMLTGKEKLRKHEFKDDSFTDFDIKSAIYINISKYSDIADLLFEMLTLDASKRIKPSKLVIDSMNLYVKYMQ